MWVRILILATMIMTPSAHAATWEDLFSAKSKDVEAKVELKKSSFRQRLVRGEKIVSAHLRMYFRENGQSSRATSDYEIHCAARTVYRSNLNMESVAADRSTSSISTSTRDLLSGKEYQDFIAFMDILCAR